MLTTEIQPKDTALLDRPAIPLPPSRDELPTEDGVPLESPWHRDEINLLLESLNYHWRERSDYYAGGNMFLYFSTQQVRNQDYRGPDFYVVKGVDGGQDREAWIVWEEGGRYPDLIVELLSPSTAQNDRTVKKALYEQVFRTPEYFCYDPAAEVLEGWRLTNRAYEAMERGANDRLWSRMLQLWLGKWEGLYMGRQRVWLRFFDEAGQLIPTLAEAEAARADAAEAELARLREELERLRREGS